MDNLDKVRVKRRPKAEKLFDGVYEILSEIADGQKSGDLYTVQGSWSEIVGDAIANISYPISFKDGVLVVRVRNAAWRNELHAQESQLVDTINKKRDSMGITKLIFK